MIVFGFTEIPEQIRTAGVATVSEGLPEPTIPPTDSPEVEVPTEVPSDEPIEEVTDSGTPEPTS
jgi:hypothetical protein